jgi:hypothetical protein
MSQVKGGLHETISPSLVNLKMSALDLYISLSDRHKFPSCLGGVSQNNMFLCPLSK